MLRMQVYILLSQKFKKTYVGFTTNLETRLKAHNWGSTKYTKKYRPWVIIHTEDFKSKAEARVREKYLKSAAGRRWIKKNLFSPVRDG